MFKPSLRKSVLNDNLCLTYSAKPDCFGTLPVQKPKPVLRFIDQMAPTLSLALPSMMIPQQILEKHQFANQNNYTHVFTPLSYDFKPYPRAVKDIISPNPKAAQAGRINSINYVVYGKNLFMWKQVKGQEEETLKIHKFQQVINIAAFSVLKNQKIFRKEKVTVLAVSFQNRVKLFKVNQNDLSIEDMLVKYQLQSCRFIQKIHFTEKNEILFAGDSGQFSMISFNGQKQLIVKVKSSIIKKYLSKSAFDYFTRHVVRDIQVSQKFLYCLHDRVSKSNYFMYLLKKAVNKVVILSEEPKHIHEETFVDVYMFTTEERNEVMFVGQLKQKDIERKIKEGYVNFWGEGVKDPFRIVAINAKGQTYSCETNHQNLQKIDEISEIIKPPQKTSQLINPIIQVTTKCGYVVILIHETTAADKNSSSLEKQNFSFAAQPTKLPSKIGQASLFQPKVFISAPQQKEYRKNFIIKSLPIGRNESLTLMNDSLMFIQNQRIRMVKFSDLKLGIFDTTIMQQYYISEDQFNKNYQSSSIKKQTIKNQEILFGQRTLVYDRVSQNRENKYYRLFNNQKRWTVFDNEGRFHIYPLSVKHIILAYLYYQCEFTYQFQRNPSQFDPNTHFLIESDLRLHSMIEKMTKLYGNSTFMKALVEILVNNSTEQREYFYLQRDLFLEVVRRQFDFDFPNIFQQWSYGLNQRSQALKIVPTDKMLQFVWIILFEHQNKPILTSETIFSQTPASEYAQRSKQYLEAKSKIQYSAYGYALKSLFYETIEILIYFRAKEFKLKQKELKKCQQTLIHFFNFLELKKSKSDTQQYKNYLEMKLSNLSKKKQQPPQQYGVKNLNATFSTTMNSTQQSFVGVDEEFDSTTITRGVTHQSNETLERFIHRSIQKIISLIDVMNILIEKDERQGLPNFIEIVTSFKSQIKIGQEFFKEELFFTPKTVQFIHPELVRQVEHALPELQLQTRINFLKFKIAKNIAVNNSLTELDLKSLNFDKLSSLITSSEIPETNKIFLGQITNLNFQKAHFYIEFLSICLSKLIKKVKELSRIKQQKFESLSEEVSLTKKTTSSLGTHMTVQKIILSQQQLEYYQEEMIKFFEEIKTVFATSVQSLKAVNGPQYYEAETYVDKMIELLITNFGTQEILVQTLQIILRDASFVEKVHFMKKVKDKIMYTKDSQVQILKISREKEAKFEEKSTFQYLMEQNDKKMIAQERTYDTWGTDSAR